MKPFVHVHLNCITADMVNIIIIEKLSSVSRQLCVADTGRKRTLFHCRLANSITVVISLECFIEITPDFLCPFMND